jgi:alpha-L-rhamnosidase
MKMIAVVGLMVCGVAVAQQPWQKMQMPTAAEVAKAWVMPTAEYGPEPYYGMNGPVTLESVQRDLDMMKSIGFRAVTVQAGYGMKQAYLSPEYFAFFKQFVGEAKKRDMRVWIVDDAGYPSGFAGGKITSEKPELRMQALAVTQRLPVKAGEALSQAVNANAVVAMAVSATGERVAVPVKDGGVAWTAPAGGDWTVLVVEHVFRTSPTRSDTNPTRAKDATQSLEDYMDPAATGAYLEFTHEQYFKAMPEEFGKTILGFRGDEPDYSISGLPWTPKFFERFQQVKGYDVRSYLGALILAQGGRGQAAVKLTEAELRAKGDYYDVFSQMFRDGFFKPQGDWCAAHHVEYQVHLNHEEMEMDLTRSEGEFIRDMKDVEVPGIDSIWHQIWTDTVSDFPRLAASAAHIYGHPRAFTETFAAYRPEPDITVARYILNEQMVRGVNLIETMYYPSTATAQAPPPAALTGAAAAAASMPAVAAPRRGGPSALMRDPGWPALMEYVRRLSYAMSMGRPAATVALYLPSSSMWLGDKDSDAQFVSTERLLSEKQIDFDLVNDDALATDLKAGPGTLETLSGNRYSVVIVPAASVMSKGAVDRLQAFAKGGGKVLFLGRTPGLIVGKTFLEGKAATAADFAWATVETEAMLPATPTPPAQPPASAPEPQVVPIAVAKALNEVVGRRTVSLDLPDTAMRVLARRLKDADVFLFFNEGAADNRHTVTLKTAGRVVEMWDPATGAVSPVASSGVSGVVQVDLSLKGYETRLLVVK